MVRVSFCLYICLIYLCPFLCFQSSYHLVEIYFAKSSYSWVFKEPIWQSFLFYFCYLKKFFLSLFILERQRERDRAQAWEGLRERETQNPKLASGSELSAQSLMWDSNSRTAKIMTWAEVRHLTKPPRCPYHSFFFFF